jgi:catechol 2,3-dioxygenase-like lactoylglutathione lyase family enzyme
MKVRRIVAYVATKNTARAKAFYQDVLGLDILMDYGWSFQSPSIWRGPLSLSSYVDSAPTVVTV